MNDENEMIEQFLQSLLNNGDSPTSIIFFQRQFNIQRNIWNPIYEKLIHYNIINAIDNDINRIVLTVLGREIAKKGYSKWLDEIETSRIQKEERERELHQATIDSATSAKKSANASWIAAIAAILAVIISIGTFVWSVYDKNISDQKIIDLEKRLDSLKLHKSK